MDKGGFAEKIIPPVLIVLAVAVLSHIGYFGSRSIANETLHQAMAALLGATYFLSVAFGVSYVFTAVLLRGGTLIEAILASAVTPMAWMTKEVFRLAQSHPVPECIYYYFNPLNFWLISLMTLQMGIGALVVRRILKKRGVDVKLVTGAPLTVIILSLTFLVGAYAWGEGENLYVIFLEGYRLIFGSGI